MTIKKYNDSYLMSPEDLLSVLNIHTDKSILIDKSVSKFELKSTSDIEGDIKSFLDAEIDGRRFRKLKKPIYKTIGDSVLNEYKTTQKIYEKVSKNFIKSSALSSVLKNSLMNNMNLIIYGAGGFGKSEICDTLFAVEELKDRVFVQSFSEATTEEDLYGGIKMKKFMDTGEKEYLVENSFMTKEIVIFEEIFDAPARVLAALKDTLTAKELRNGNQRFPIKTKVIIGLTNKSFEEVIEDDSTEALTQRFPISYKLEYKMSKMEIASLIANKYNDFSADKMSAIVESAEMMNSISPRKLLEMAKYIKGIDIRANKNYLERITNNEISTVINYLKVKKTVDFAKVAIEFIIKEKRNIREEVITDYDSFIDIKQNSLIIKNYVEGLGLEEGKLNSILSELTELENMIDKKI